MPEARAAIFRALHVSSVINGAGLRKTRVWPQVDAPFCLLFARNRVAGPGAAIRFVSPLVDASADKSGVLRIDAAHAPIVRVDDMLAMPERLKILFRGSELDLEIYERILARRHPELLDAVVAAGGVSGNGVQDLRPSSPLSKIDGLPGVDASRLKGMPFLVSGGPPPVIRASYLPRFEEDRLHRIRDLSIFRGPLLIVGKTMRAGVPGFSSGLSLDDVVYKETCYGYGFRAAPTGDRTAFYLHLILRSSFARWWMLMTSGEFGFEREVVEKEILDRLPVPSFAGLQEGRRDEVENMYVKFMLDALDQEDIEDWVASIYGLGAEDRQVMADTLAYGMSEVHDSATVRKDGAPSRMPEAAEFVRGLTAELEPWAERFGRSLKARPLNSALTPAWGFLVLGPDQAVSAEELPGKGELAGFVQAADATGSTEIYHEDDEDRLWLGLLAQPRFWTYYQGVRAARHLIWNHVDFLVGQESLDRIAS